MTRCPVRKDHEMMSWMEKKCYRSEPATIVHAIPIDSKSESTLSAILLKELALVMALVAQSRRKALRSARGD